MCVSVCLYECYRIGLYKLQDQNACQRDCNVDQKIPYVFLFVFLLLFFYVVCICLAALPIKTRLLAMWTQSLNRKSCSKTRAFRCVRNGCRRVQRFGVYLSSGLECVCVSVWVLGVVYACIKNRLIYSQFRKSIWPVRLRSLRVGECLIFMLWYACLC